MYSVVSIRIVEYPPTQRTTRYSVFKERPRSWELVENSLRQTCAEHFENSGQEFPPRVVPQRAPELT
jgi:hypothetical protein